MASKWLKRGRRWYFSAGLLTAISPLWSGCAPTPTTYYPPIVDYPRWPVVAPLPPSYSAPPPDTLISPGRQGDQAEAGSAGSSTPPPGQQAPQGREPTATSPNSEPSPAPPDKEAESHSPTCGNWRLGCGILWP
jgi:hypothetical protein